jgi:adenylyltransferase/sulfurtransferase
MHLTKDQQERYLRHLKLPEVGEEGQKKLLRSKVLIIGSGGLGSPASLYLAAAGVGTLGLADPDLVDRSNLQRQVLHSEETIGRLKVVSAEAGLRALNSEIDIRTFPVRIDTGNVLEIIKGYDCVVDASDNFDTRYLVNAACVLLKKTDIYGAVYRFEGQASVLRPGEGPCYRCLFPEPPSTEKAALPSSEGLFGVLPGLIGIIQATEAIKALLGIGTSLAGRLLLYDSLKMTFREAAVKRDPDCPICGEKSRLKQITDYKKHCGLENS